MTQQDVVAASNAAADAAGIPRLLLLAAGCAESGLNPFARRPADPADDERYWPDVSGGVWQQTVRWDPDYHGGSAYPGPVAIANVLTRQYDPERSARIAAANLRGKYRQGEPDAVFRALCRYNWPAGDGEPASDATAANYHRGIAEATTLLGDAPMPTVPTYNPTTPPQRQVQSWTCSIRSTAWVLASLGLPVDIGALQDEMSPTYVTPEDGLRDGRGYGVAATIKAHLPADWQDHVQVFESITWDELRSLAGIGPIAIGLEGAYHWLNVAGARPDGDLDAPNPAPNYPASGPIGDVLSRAEFDKYGPASAVFVNAAAAPVPAAPPTPAPTDELARLRAELADKTARLEAEVSKLGYISGDVATACDRVAEAAAAIANTLRSLKPPAA